MQPITEKLLRAWELVPDWRLCQLVSNLHGTGPQDIFHTSDEAFEAGLDQFIAVREQEVMGGA
jgi:hypothetical protein